MYLFFFSKKVFSCFISFLDAQTFSAVGMSGPVYKVAVNPTDTSQFLMGGKFEANNINNIALYSTISNLTTPLGVGCNSHVFSFHLEQDGKLFVVGNFTSCGVVSSRCKKLIENTQ